MIGVEALIRWMHPTRGLLTPYHFIGGLEEFGLINEVGEWVLQTACEQMRRWHAMDFEPMRIGVNVSAQQFEDPLLIDKVRSALDEHQALAGVLGARAHGELPDVVTRPKRARCFARFGTSASASRSTTSARDTPR